MSGSKNFEDSKEIFDYVVVGGGSSGCVMANRLSAAGATTVLLEAGPDTPPGAVPADIADTYSRSYSNPAYAWQGLRADSGPGGTEDVFPQARVMGGGSSVMGMIAVRGVPHDYDHWAASGANGWAWADVLPAFRRLESDWDFGGELHGDSGPIPIRRHSTADWPPFSHAIGEAAATIDLPFIDDMNGDFGDGHGRLPLSATLSSRVSAAIGYLDARTRARPNLAIRPNTMVERLKLDGDRCVGVHAVHNRRRYLCRARHVIVCAGAIHSPAILMRSGIGPEQDLKRLGSPVHGSLDGVGRNLQNHSVLYLAAHLKPDARQSPLLRPQFNSALRFSSGPGADRQSDMIMLVISKSSWHGVGQAIAGLGVGLYRPHSRGTVKLRSLDPSTPPEIAFGLLAEQADRERMRAGLELAAELMSTPQVLPLRNEAFIAGYSDTVRRLNRPTRLNAVVTSALARLLDGPPSLRKAVIRGGIARGEREDQIGTSDWINSTVDDRSFMMYHPVGTCAMGSEDSADAVLTPDCRVRGFAGLSVVDASVMPTIPRGNTNLPAIMVAEHASRMILDATPGQESGGGTI